MSKIIVGDETIDIPLSREIKSENAKRIEALFDKIDMAIFEAVVEYTGTGSDKAIDAVLSLLEDGREAEAVAIITGAAEPIGNRAVDSAYAAGIFTTASLIGMVAMATRGTRARKIAEANAVRIEFTKTDPEVFRMLQSLKQDFLGRFQAEQRDVIMEAIREGIAANERPRQYARRIRDVIGLSTTQTEILRAYEQQLRLRDRKALQSDLRDKRYDPLVRRIIRDGGVLSEAQIEALVAARRRKTVKARAESLAKNISAEAISRGRELAFRRTLALAGIDNARGRKEWRSQRDERVRHTHVGLDGQVVGTDGMFTSPSGALLAYPRDPMAPADEVVNCRCYLIYSIKEG